MSHTLSIALNYALRGWKILPIKLADKRPLTPHGYKDATSDSAIISEWFSCWPDANIGIATGAASGVIVLDVDPRNGGNESFAAIASLIPSTLTARTGGGGKHLYFKYCTGLKNSNGKLGTGLDIKTDKGYVVAPPSLHPSGQLYEWENPDFPIVEFPDALFQKLSSSNNLSTYTPENCDSIIHEGNRNVSLVSIAGKLRRIGLEEESLFLVLQTVNQTQCSPPLDNHEIRNIAKSICRYKPTHEWHKNDDQTRAEVMQALFGEDLRFCAEQKRWYVFNGKVWVLDNPNVALQRAKEVSDILKEIAASAPNELPAQK